MLGNRAVRARASKSPVQWHQLERLRTITMCMYVFVCRRPFFLFPMHHASMNRNIHSHTQKSLAFSLSLSLSCFWYTHTYNYKISHILKISSIHTRTHICYEKFSEPHFSFATNSHPGALEMKNKQSLHSYLFGKVDFGLIFIRVY